MYKCKTSLIETYTKMYKNTRFIWSIIRVINTIVELCVLTNVAHFILIEVLQKYFTPTEYCSTHIWIWPIVLNETHIRICLVQC